MRPHKTFAFLLLCMFCVSLFFYRDFISLGISSFFESNEVNTNTSEALKDEIPIPAYILDTTRLLNNRFAETPLISIETDSNLPTPLRHFYKALHKLDLDSTYFLRVLHYGDKAIENDRISHLMRKWIQEAFNGKGNGILPFEKKLPKSWHRTDMKTAMRRGNFGIQNAYIYPLLAKQGFASIGWKFNQNFPAGMNLQALVREEISPAEIRLHTEKKKEVIPISKSETLYGLTLYTWKIPQSFSQLQIQVDMGKNHAVYAFSLQDSKGILWDNLCMPNMNGEIFFQNNRQFLTNNYHLLNVHLLVYQFHELAEKERILTELSYLHSLLPEVSILVIGSESIKETALLAGCAFLDDENFSKQNEIETAKMLYKSIISDYRNYIEKSANLH